MAKRQQREDLQAEIDAAPSQGDLKKLKAEAEELRAEISAHKEKVHELELLKQQSEAKLAEAKRLQDKCAE
nr:hypothetical protein [Gammaproteobacteria bacterium]NIR82327.1 hypothetical protein [Gammaproteobacteria bacterium]NIU03468.1 hypothetical protein [Gammaproteobacteria bacterium]NIV50895.1 hypothetical protein [Gammaproteobacteria bacterium]NIX84743.1 hypothetical protein [Gammaproteobacteria bacterium]